MNSQPAPAPPHFNKRALPPTTKYGIVASGPAVSRDEVETGERSLELIVMWGSSSVLHVEHLSPPRPWSYGEPRRGDEHEVGFLIGKEVIGALQRPLVVGSGDSAAVVIPPGARGAVTLDGKDTSLEELRSRGDLLPFEAWPGAEHFTPPHGATVRFAYQGFTFIAKSVAAGRRIHGGVRDLVFPLVSLAPYLGAVAVLAAVFLAIMYVQPPTGAGLNFDSLEPNHRLVQYVLEPDELQTSVGASSLSMDEATPSGMPEPDGARGEGDPNSNDPAVAAAGGRPARRTRPSQPTDAREAGILGVLGAVSRQLLPGPSFGDDSSLGTDPSLTIASLFGEHLGLGPNGPGGIGMLHSGRPTGYHGPGIRTGGFRTNPGVGPRGPGPGDDWNPTREPRTPVRIGSPQVDTGSGISRESIRRAVRRHLNEVSFCYEQALGTQPDLAGRVTISFIIGPSGSVMSATVGQSDLGNQRVENCIATAVRRWAFDMPEDGGVVAVRYPFMLAPSN